LKIGQKFLKNGEKKDLNRFIAAWNTLVDTGIKPSIDMFRLYNKIKVNNGESLWAIRFKEDIGIRLRNYGDLPNSIYHWIPKKGLVSKETPRRIKEWLILSDLIEGHKPLIKVRTTNSETGKNEVIYIPNRESYWNKNGLNHKQLDGAKRAFYQKSGLFEKIKFKRLKTIYDKKLKKKVRPYDPLKQAIIDKLEEAGYFYPNGVTSRKIWFKEAYKLRYNEELVTEYLEVIYWERIAKLRFRENDGYKLALKAYYEKIGQKITYFNDDIIHFDPLSEIFEIFIVDEFQALYETIEVLKQDVAKLSRLKTLTQLINRLKDVDAAVIARVIAKAKLKIAIPTQITFSLTEADQYEEIIGSKITRDSTRFWMEKYTDSFSGFIAALIMDPRIRLMINDFTKQNDKLSHLELPENVISEVNWAHDPSVKNLVTLPDVITKFKSGRRFFASEIIQNKLLREIGEMKGQITPTYYFLDYLKTLGTYDPLTNRTKNIQMEFIPKGRTLSGLTNLAKKSNVIILSYWSNSMVEIGRIAEVIQAIRLSKYDNHILDPEIIVKEVYKRLDQGNEALGFKRRIDQATKKLIQELLEISKGKGETLFYRDVYLKLLEKYTCDSSFSNN
jgi:hypothetical protein